MGLERSRIKLVIDLDGVSGLDDKVKRIQDIFSGPVCKDCGKAVADVVVDFCKRNNFDGIYCRDCQSKHKPAGGV